MRQFLSFFILFLSSLVFAQEKANLAQATSSNCMSALLAEANCFQLGDSWNKTELKDARGLSKLAPQLISALQGTAQFRLGASGILLGQFRDQWVMAAAYHMCSSNFGGMCKPFALSGDLRVLRISFQAEQVIGYWPELDLILFTVVFHPNDESKLNGVGSNFDFHSKLKSGTQLVVAGYTAITGFSGNLPLSADSDCKILSGTAESRLMKDPDTVSPDPEKKWAFAIGCDIARGDSGGPVIDSQSGKILGLVWTGKTPTSDFAKSSLNLEKLQRDHDPKVWSEVGYASSVLKIGETFKKLIKDPKAPVAQREIIRSILSGGMTNR